MNNYSKNYDSKKKRKSKTIATLVCATIASSNLMQGCGKKGPQGPPGNGLKVGTYDATCVYLNPDLQLTLDINVSGCINGHGIQCLIGEDVTPDQIVTLTCANGTASISVAGSAATVTVNCIDSIAGGLLTTKDSAPTCTPAI